jgi:hypothetical protein
MGAYLVPRGDAALRKSLLSHPLDGCEKFPKRALASTFSHPDSELVSQEPAYLPPHRDPYFRQARWLVAPGIGECDECGRREEDRRKRRTVGLELKGLRFARATVIVSKTMSERCLQIETQETRQCRRHGFESTEDEELSSTRARLRPRPMQLPPWQRRCDPRKRQPRCTGYLVQHTDLGMRPHFRCLQTIPLGAP